MKEFKFSFKKFLFSTLSAIIVVSVLNTFIWVWFHGVPLLGLPNVNDVESVNITYNNEEKTITDSEKIEIIVNGANLLNYKLIGDVQSEPIIIVEYNLKTGETIELKANYTTMWWKGKAYPIKQKEVFVNIMEGLFFN